MFIFIHFRIHGDDDRLMAMINAYKCYDKRHIFQFLLQDVFSFMYSIVSNIVLIYVFVNDYFITCIYNKNSK